MIWIGRDLKDILFQPHCHRQRHLLDHVAQSPVQAGLDEW